MKITNSKKTLWCVMKSHNWSSITVFTNMPLVSPSGGPHGFIPVFNTRKEAIEWDGSEEYVRELQIV